MIVYRTKSTISLMLDGGSKNNKKWKNEDGKIELLLSWHLNHSNKNKSEQLRKINMEHLCKYLIIYTDEKYNSILSSIESN